MNKEFNGFDEMVEALEENEDMVECKECFELFPKVDCERSDIGYVCPVCRGLRTPIAQARFVDPYDSYTQDFPEVTEYDPDSVVEYEKEPGLGDALSDLIRDEYEAIDGYEVADETIQHADIDEDEKDEILDTLDHIKEEEEEHIDELKELCPECDPKEEPKAEPEKLEEAADDEEAAEEDEVEEIPEEESPEEEAEDSEENENEEVSDLDSAYEAALEIANKSGVGQVFGYARKETEEFVAIEPFEVDDPEAVEEDLMAVYDDVAYAYVAYPEKNLEEALFESVQLNEANFLKNLFTRENQSLDAFFINKFVVKTGNNTEGPYQWADAEKIAASKTDDTAVIIAKKVPVENLKDKWPIEIVNKLGGKDIQMATYNKGKATLNNEVSKLLTQIKAAAKGQKIAQKAGATTTTFNDPYGRTSLQDAVKDSPINPIGVAVHKLINMLFDHFTVSRGLSYSADADASTTGKGIQIISSGYRKEFDTFKDALTAATTASARKPDVADYDEFESLPEGALTIVELYGHYKDFDSKIISKLDRYITRPEEVGLLDQAADPAGPVHLFTFSVGKAIADTKCTALDKYFEVKANIIEDLQDAGYDVSGEPGKAVKKNDDNSSEESAEEDPADEDPNLDDDEDEVSPKDKAKQMLGEKKVADGYTPESYKKYEAAYAKILAWIEAHNKPESLTQERMDNLKKQAEAKLVAVPDEDPNLDDDAEEATGDNAGDTAALDEAKAKAKETLGEKKAADGYTEDSYATYSENYDKILAAIEGAESVEALEALNIAENKTKNEELLVEKTTAEEPSGTEADSDEEEVDTEDEESGETTGEVKLSEVSEEQLKKLYTAVTGQGVGDNKKWQKVLARMRAKLQELGESLDPQDYSAEDFIEEEFSSEAEVAKSLKDTQATLKSTADSLKNMTNAMKESILNLSPADFAECVDSSRVELWGLEEPEDGVAPAVLIKSYDDVANEDVQACHDEMLDLDGMFTFCFTASGKPSLWGWNAEQLRELSRAGIKGISFDDLAYEEAVNLAWRIK